MSGSSPTVPVDCTIDFDKTGLVGKVVVVTGGASGIGEAYVRALVEAKLKVCLGDLNVDRGEQLASELPGCYFVQCNVTNWQDQLSLFNKAASLSSSGKIDYVIANAGIIHNDDVFTFDGHKTGPIQPNLDIIDINLSGALYTTKLALHYFISQNGTSVHPDQTDTCLVLIGSGASYLDCPRGPQYSASKYAMRGIMHSLRRTAFYHGSRINMISPWYVRTSILDAATFDHVEASGVQLASAEDAGECLLRLLSDTEINGRSLFVAPRKWAKRGYVDLDLDEYVGNEFVQEIQKEQVKSAPVEMGLFVE